MKHNRKACQTPGVQSCITNVSFPKTARELEKMIQKNSRLREEATDIDTLLEFTPEHETSFTAPRWITEGDIVFFYHTGTAKARVAKVRREVERSSPKFDHLRQVLDHAEALVHQYSRTVFACARVSGPTCFEEDPEDRQHFENRIFAPLGEVHIFEHPIPLQVFQDIITLNPAGGPTLLPGRQFTGLKKLLAGENDLPEFLRQTVPASAGRNYESQLREHLDVFLSELKDKRTPLLEECTCYRGGAQTGKVDYFVCLKGIWFPVEAKLNVNAVAERNLQQQVSKYVHVDSFRPQKGRHRGKGFKAHDIPLCLVIDQHGIYLWSDGTFVECQPGKPIWHREELGRGICHKVRTRLAELLASCNKA
jgi:hypothetical protein